MAHQQMNELALKIQNDHALDASSSCFVLPNDNGKIVIPIKGCGCTPTHRVVRDIFKLAQLVQLVHLVQLVQLVHLAKIKEQLVLSLWSLACARQQLLCKEIILKNFFQPYYIKIVNNLVIKK